MEKKDVNSDAKDARGEDAPATEADAGCENAPAIEPDTTSRDATTLATGAMNGDEDMFDGVDAVLQRSFATYYECIVRRSTGAPRQQRDYGQRTYKLQKIKTRITYSKDRHILAPFSWKRVVESKAPALLFLGACSAVAGVRGLARIPDDPQHLLDALDTTSILRLVEEGALENRKQADFARQTSRDYDNFEKEKKRFYEKLQLPEKSAIARTRANAKKDKKR
ncbi:hypothetical protein PC118_g22185 [Phytophthora cactorum]|uniref:Uncharacterized protein n=1 Tax=Phytophthora cactorum TaxID=29920 RepID=A0A8T1F2L3_9STRA|nr:hypothetical protein PC118_g22185 [Phytophthora cactorum]